MSRAKLPKLSREELGYRNAIAQGAGTLDVQIGGAEWKLQFARNDGEAKPQGAPSRLQVEWGGAPFSLDVPGDVAERFLRESIPGAELAQMPEALQLAALELMRSELERSLAPKGGAAPRPVRVKSYGPASGPAPWRHRYGFTLRSGTTGEAISGEVSTDASGLSYAAPLLRAAKRSQGEEAPAWIDDVAVPVRIEAGSTLVDRAELAEAEPGDLILLDECFLSPQGEMAILAAPGLGFRGRVEDTKITVTQPLGAVMAETPTAAASATGASADRIPVRLTFELGERSMTVAELRDLKPGYTFDLGRDLRRAVSIRAQGQVIGEGELVEIDGTLGVAITSLGAAAK